LVAGTVQDADGSRTPHQTQTNTLLCYTPSSLKLSPVISPSVSLEPGSAIGIGLIGARMVEAIGRNPATLPKVLVFGLLTIALSEAMGIFGLIFGLFQGK
jgi:hypothetical protein